MIISINPYNNRKIKEYNELTPGEVKSKIENAHIAFWKWKETSFEHRASLMKNAADILQERSEVFAHLMTAEMGKLLRSGKAEAEKCGWVCRFYAENAKKFLTPEKIKTEMSSSFVTFNPLGVVLAVMPWNFPFWQVFRFAAPALMAGNTCLLKHASNVPGCALAIEEIFQKAGFPKDVFQTLLIGSRQVSAVIEHPHIKAVTLTGSTPAGRAVAKKAGEMIKKCVLELGGSDPYIILEDADIEMAVEKCLTSKLINSGQSCIAAKRFIVVDAVREQFEKLFLEKMENQVMGDPFSLETTIGPMARTDLRDELHQQVIQSIDKGAKCLLGGYIPEMEGAFYPVTILTDIIKEMPAYDEELFGPVAAIIPAKDENEAIKIANDTKFGLGAAVFTSNIEKGKNIAANLLDAGCCFVNDFVKSDPRLPFGGIKESGFGRELSHYGIKEFVNIKTICIK
jgi:succinate-semialdehyde dehydrogenase/glutarate-semialdehyde dehydrogenase